MGLGRGGRPGGAAAHRARHPRRALDVTCVERILLSGETPFQALGAASAAALLSTLDDPQERHLVAAGNAAALFGIALDPARRAHLDPDLVLDHQEH